MFRPRKPTEARVVTVARISSDWVVKGLPAFVRVARQLAPTPFDILGPVQVGDVARRLREMAPPNVSFRGPVSHEGLPEVLGGTAVYAQFSLRETFCLALVEAMLSGCTPVVSNAGALPEVVGETGRVVPVGDDDAASAAVRAALEQPSGEAARQRASDAFPIEKRVRALCSLVVRLGDTRNSA
jgi:glycosyltransferase involved in cell wall biosynthesis